MIEDSANFQGVLKSWHLSFTSQVFKSDYILTIIKQQQNKEYWKAAHCNITIAQAVKYVGLDKFWSAGICWSKGIKKKKKNVEQQ